MRGVAIVGASERNPFTTHAIQNIKAYGYSGAIWPINPRYSELDGMTCYPGIGALPGQAELVIVAVATERCAAIVAEAVDAKIPHIVVVTDGFAEAGRMDLQEELVAIVAGSQSRLYGPNCLGFFDSTAALCAMAVPIPPTLRPGPVSLISQSGAMVAAFMSASVEDGFGVDWCLSLGNGAALDIAQALHVAVSRSSTKVVCLYAESLGPDPTAFGAALDLARQLGKWVVVLKVGSSDLGSRIALSHTASMVGPDNLVSSFLESHGALRADSLEELVRLASLCAIIEGRPTGGVAVVGSSGGMATMAGDAAQRFGLHLAAFTPDTFKAIAAVAPEGSFVDNPFDIVRPGTIEGGINVIWRHVYADPNVSFVLAPWVGIYPDPGRTAGFPPSMIMDFEALANEYAKPTASVSLAVQTWTNFAETARDAHSDNFILVRGLETTLKALAKLFPAPVRDKAAHADGAPSTHDAGKMVLLSEEEGRQILGSTGLPLVRGATFASVDEIDLTDMQFPVVVKVVASGVNHKASVGGVRLGCLTANDAVRAAREILDAVDAAGVPKASVHGIRIEEMVRGPNYWSGCSAIPASAPISPSDWAAA